MFPRFPPLLFLNFLKNRCFSNFLKPFGPETAPKACARQGLWQQALAVFATAQQAGMEDGVMIAVTISACEKGGKIAEGVGVAVAWIIPWLGGCGW